MHWDLFSGIQLVPALTLFTPVHHKLSSLLLAVAHLILRMVVLRLELRPPPLLRILGMHLQRRVEDVAIQGAVRWSIPASSLVANRVKGVGLCGIANARVDFEDLPGPSRLS